LEVTTLVDRQNIEALPARCRYLLVDDEKRLAEDIRILQEESF
jgi:hypothetical protein